MEKGNLNGLLGLTSLYNKNLQNKFWIRPSEIEEYYLKYIEQKDDVDAIFYLAEFCYKLGYHDKAAKYYLIAARKGHIESLKIILKNWSVIKNNDISFEILRLCIKYQDDLNIYSIYNLLEPICRKYLTKEEKNEIVDLISQIKIKADEKIPFLLESNKI